MLANGNIGCSENHYKRFEKMIIKKQSVWKKEILKYWENEIFECKGNMGDN